MSEPRIAEDLLEEHATRKKAWRKIKDKLLFQHPHFPEDELVDAVECLDKFFGG